MKKLLYLFLLLIPVSFSSCLKNGGNYEEDPITPGIKIYNLATEQNNLSLKPVDSAFRLNVLLTEAKMQDVDITDAEALGKMKVEIEKKQYTLMSILFQDNTVISSIDNGVYRLKFAYNGFYGSADTDGYVTINTGGKTLEELADSDIWLISVSGNNNENFIVYTDNYYNGYEIEEIVVSDDVGYSIVPGFMPQSWDIKVEDFVCRSSYYKDSNLKSSWSGEFTMNQISGKEGLGFENTHESVFEFYGYGTGDAFRGGNMRYEIPGTSALRCKPECDDKYKSYLVDKGIVKAKFTSAEDVNTEYFESLSAEVEWEKGSLTCSASLTIRYNGLEKTY